MVVRPTVVLPALLWLWLTPALAAAPAAPKPDATYKQLELFARVLSYVQNNYVEPVDEQQLIYGAIKGMLDTLDPHTVFMPPDVFKEMKIDTSGEFGGLGIEIARKSDAIVVVAPIDDTPARARRHQARRPDPQDRRRAHPAAWSWPAPSRRCAARPARRCCSPSCARASAAPREFAIIRDHIRIVSVEGALYGGIGHVKVKNFQERTDASLLQGAGAAARAQNGGKELRGLVLDLRNNPGGLLDQAVAISDRFLPGNLTIVTTRGRDGRRSPRSAAKDRDTEQQLPDGGAGQRAAAPRPRRSSPARCRTTAARCIMGIAHLRQGQRADGDRAGGRLGPQADHRPLLHAHGPQHPGEGHHPRLRGAARPEGRLPGRATSCARRT